MRVRRQGADVRQGPWGQRGGAGKEWQTEGIWTDTGQEEEGQPEGLGQPCGWPLAGDGGVH